MSVPNRKKHENSGDEQSTHGDAESEIHCDLSVTCPVCVTEMEPEHSHYRCRVCGYRDSCCF